MALGGDRITFWFGCNMLRHAEMIRLSIMLLERVGYDVSAAGGPAYCCGTAHDHQPRGASNMASRTVARFNEAAEKDGRSTVVTWCPSCHMHMSDIMAPGNATTFGVTHITELLAARVDRLAPLLTVPVKRRVLLHRHVGFASHVQVNDRVIGLLRGIPSLELSRDLRIPGTCAAPSPQFQEPWQRLLVIRGRPSSRTVATQFAPSFIPATASYRLLMARMMSASGTGSSWSPRAWESAQATHMLTGARVARRIFARSRMPIHPSITPL